MKKFLTTCAMVALVAVSANAAQQQSECAYSPRQTLVRDALDANQIAGLIQQGVIFDETPRCGGSLMQLAVRRGNPDVLKVLLEQDLKRANQVVSLDEFPIPGAPKKIPLWLFAAYYAPNEYIITLLHQALTQSNPNSIAMTDDLGRNVLWYMDRNPVLRKTALYDQLNAQLLTTLSTGNNADAALNAALSDIIPGVKAQKAPVTPNVPSQQPELVPGKLSLGTTPGLPAALQQQTEVVEPSK